MSSLCFFIFKFQSFGVLIFSFYSQSHLKGVLLFNLWSLPSRSANDASRVRVRVHLSSSRVVNISSRARARVELTRAELDSTH